MTISDRMRRSWESGGRYAVLILSLTFVAYIPAMRAGFVWDDQQNVTENQLLRTVDGLRKTWMDPHASIQYYPLTYTGFWVQYQLWGLHPARYHVVNVLLHALNAILVGVLLTRLSVPGAWLAACLFAVHPVHVESVAWITELKNVLSGFFFLCAFLAYLRFANGAANRWWCYGLAFLLFVCALLSKTATIALPAAILLVLWWKKARIGWRDLLPLLPFFLAAALMATLTNWVEEHHSGAVGSEWQLSLVERILIAGRAVWFYAGKLIWPHPLMFIYPRWRIDPAAWWQYLYPGAVLAVLAALWLLRGRLGKAPLIAAFLFVGALAPVPAFFNLYFMRFSYVTDHFQYLPSIGLIALMASIAWRVSGSRRTLMTVAAPVIALLGILTWQHCKVFRNNETIWRDTVAKNPDCWLALNNLGRIVREAGDIYGAIEHYRAALQVKPDYAEAHYNLGNAFVQLGRMEDAVGQYEWALQLDPNYVGAHGNLAFVLLRTGKVQQAIDHLEQAVRINPNSTEAQYNLALTLAQNGDLDDAQSHFETAIRLSPGYAEAHYALAMLLTKRNLNNEAVLHLQRAVQLEPTSERFRRALDMVQRSNIEPATQ